ncbi:MAG: 4Fe-4S binding protein [Sedimentisphaerales bacterium]|nr:4Fe-4S binding protein [Sedimentisphaerales bacterium]
MQKLFIQFVVLIAAVVGLSFASSQLWGAKPEAQMGDRSLVIEEGMTVAQYGRRNELPPELLKKVFGLVDAADQQRHVAAFGMSNEQILRKTQASLALRSEHGSKNWAKIVVKFALWLAFLAFVFLLMAHRRVKAKNRTWLLLVAVTVFGVALGSDPSPMGTVKDAIVLLVTRRVVFPPRLIALVVFLIMVVVANKFICSWGCQLGTLQDAIFRLNRDKQDRRGLIRQFKVPFALSNSVRVVFFIAIIVFASLWATDIVEDIDPFKTFKPQALGWAGAVFVGVTFILSLFTWRPWCHFLCPFGLVGWVAEKISVFKIQVDYDKCIACGACEKACPSTVMGAILKRDRVIPDCFSCATCMETCPAQAISFKAGQRRRPPAGKFSSDVGTATAPVLPREGEQEGRTAMEEQRHG